MAARAVVVLVAAAMAAAVTTACARRELTVIEATYGASCGAFAGNATGAVARACDGTTACTFAVDVRRLGDPAVGCEKDFRVTWRCATEEGIRSARVPGEAGLGATVALQCRGPVVNRIEVLDAVVGTAPVAGLSAAAAARCGGQASCTVTAEDLAPRPGLPLGEGVRLHWRCEGDMARRETVVKPGQGSQLTCE